MFGGLAAVAVAGALAFVGLPIASASAGSNGQHVFICADNNGGSRVRVVGFNQDGVLAIQDMYFGQLRCVESAWWWKGDVSVVIMRSDGSWYVHDCQVPERSRDDAVLC
jgi:hypothetical protein